MIFYQRKSFEIVIVLLDLVFGIKLTLYLGLIYPLYCCFMSSFFSDLDFLYYAVLRAC